MRQAFLSVFFAFAHAANAAAGTAAPVAEGRDVQATMASKTYLDAHPDLKFRVEGFHALEQGRFDEARAHFTRAASYADKPSQAILAELAWRGIGKPVDRVLGYAWSDIAAERGYPAFVAQRERYWSQLSADEQSRAIEIGQPLMAEHGDAAAKPRIARHLRLARRYMFTGRPRKDVTVVVPSPSGQQMVVRGHDFYANRFWDPEDYQSWVDSTWSNPRQGQVEIGELEQAGAKP
ncbi:MAG: hypothetical protein AB7U81_15225 [Thiohalomonadaceae bacterium]